MAQVALSPLLFCVGLLCRRSCVERVADSSRIGKWWLRFGNGLWHKMWPLALGARVSKLVEKVVARPDDKQSGAFHALLLRALAL